MRKVTNFLLPVTVIGLYYAFWAGVIAFLLVRFPALRDFFPVGGLHELADRAGDPLAPVQPDVEESILSLHGPLRLAFASLGAGILIVPVSWVYFITSRTREVDQSFVQTIVIMPVVVTGIAMIVLNSLALAFSLAGVVAAVRFRFALEQPADAMYIFVAISIGLGCGIGSLGAAGVISMAFVYANLVIWRFEYGKSLSGPFFSMLTRRNRVEDDLE
jgi:hypothetical protein